MVAKKAQIIDTNKSVDVADININKGEDGVDRYVLDSADKIVRWIKFKFDEQSKWLYLIQILIHLFFNTLICQIVS